MLKFVSMSNTKSTNVKAKQCKKNSLGGGSSIGPDRLLLAVCSQRAAGDRSSSACEEQTLTSGYNCASDSTQE